MMFAPTTIFYSNRMGEIYSRTGKCPSRGDAITVAFMAVVLHMATAEGRVEWQGTVGLKVHQLLLMHNRADQMQVV